MINTKLLLVSCLLILLIVTPSTLAAPSPFEDEFKSFSSSIGAVFQVIKGFIDILINILYYVYYFVLVLLFFFVVIMLFYIPMRIYRDYYIPNRTVVNKLLQLTRH